MRCNVSEIYCKDIVRVPEPLTSSSFELLDLEEIILFSINTEDYHSHLNEFSSVISKPELARAHKFYRSTDKNNYIISHGILRIILSQYLGIPPKEIQYLLNENKKPSLMWGAPFFNISNSKNCTLFGFSNEEIGVDVEFMPHKSNNAITLKSILHPTEIDFIEKSGLSEKEFFKIWTRKEALFKCLGTGLPDVLSRLSCLYGRNLWQHNFFDEQKALYLQSLEVDSNYICAIASSGKVYPRVRHIDPKSLKKSIKVILKTL